MLSLQETTVRYMHQQFQPELFSLLVDCCTTLAGFAVTQFEDDLINLIAASEDLHSDDVRDQFVVRIRQALCTVIKEHMIELDQETEPTLSELNALAQFIARVQDLEDTAALEYRLHGLGTPKQILIDVMGAHCQLNRFRAMEIIAGVDVKLIKAMQLMTKDKAVATDNINTHAKVWRNFVRFLGNDTACLGMTLKRSGYFGLDLNAMDALLATPLSQQIQAVVPTNLPQASLDLLSTLMLCTDTYENPTDAVGKHVSALFNDATHLSQVKSCMNAMYLDFNNWLQALKPGLSTQQDMIQ